jgi:glutamyl-tRNA synthetase
MGRSPSRRLTQAPDLLRFLFTDDLEPNEPARELIRKAGPDYLREAAEALERLPSWTAAAIQAALDDLATRHGLSRAKAWQPIRAAVTASNVSPPLPESLELLGRERTVARLRAAAASL